MATVRFSDDLRQQIKNNASSMFDDRITKARENPPNWAGNIYDLALSTASKARGGTRLSTKIFI